MSPAKKLEAEGDQMFGNRSFHPKGLSPKDQLCLHSALAGGWLIPQALPESTVSDINAQPSDWLVKRQISKVLGKMTRVS